MNYFELTLITIGIIPIILATKWFIKQIIDIKKNPKDYRLN